MKFLLPLLIAFIVGMIGYYGVCGESTVSDTTDMSKGDIVYVSKSTDITLESVKSFVVSVITKDKKTGQPLKRKDSPSTQQTVNIPDNWAGDEYHEIRISVAELQEVVVAGDAKVKITGDIKSFGRITHDFFLNIQTAAIVGAMCAIVVLVFRFEWNRRNALQPA